MLKCVSIFYHFVATPTNSTQVPYRLCALPVFYEVMRIHKRYDIPALSLYIYIYILLT